MDSPGARPQYRRGAARGIGVLDLAYLFSFHGRMRRRDWWLTRLVAWVPMIVLMAFTDTLGMLTGALDGAALLRPGVWIPLAVVFPIIAWFDVATSVKRLHDIDITGWAYLMIFVPWIGAVANFVVMGCLDGTRGPNKFGNSPKWPEITREAMIFD
jgi:uncharacterized membrane protein YhaH (DUF805 family)